MALSCGIIGLPLVGKTTLFNLLTRAGAETSTYAGRTGTNMRTASIPDWRLDFLASLYKPRKLTPATLEVIDVPGLTRGAGAAFLASVREADALIHVIRVFHNDEVVHVEADLDPLRDLETIDAELLLADLQLVETRLERINSSKKIKGETRTEMQLLQRCQEILEAEKPLSEAGFTDQEWLALQHISFLTTKPMLVVANIDEEQLHTGYYESEQKVKTYAADKGYPILSLCARLEEEIASLDTSERGIFLKEMGIAEAGIERLARAVYHHLGLISFLTSGEDEVRAWTIKKGTTARAAAGKVHSDMERGFIRAEVVSYADLNEQGNMQKAREKGLVRLEGKEYIVQDGDIINFRFNV